MPMITVSFSTPVANIAVFVQRLLNGGAEVTYLSRNVGKFARVLQWIFDIYREHPLLPLAYTMRPLGVACLIGLAFISDVSINASADVAGYARAVGVFICLAGLFTPQLIRWLSRPFLI